MAKPIVISKSVCANCKAVKKRLDAKNIEYRELNADIDTEAKEHIEQHGLLAVPALIDGEQVYRNVADILDWMRTL